MTYPSVKRFTTEIPATKEGIGRFLGFEPLNDTIERLGSTEEDVIAAYHRVLLEEPNGIEVDPLDEVVRDLTQQSGIAVNRILDFVDYKFSDITSLIEDLDKDKKIFSCSPRGTLNEVIEGIKNLTPQKFYGSINTGNGWETERFHAIFEISRGDTIETTVEKFQNFLNTMSNAKLQVYEEFGEAYPIVKNEHWYSQTFAGETKKPGKKQKKKPFWKRKIW